MTTLDALRAITNDEAMVKAAETELKRINELAKAVRVLRNEAIRRLDEEYGSTETAKRIGKSVSAVKWINGPR